MGVVCKRKRSGIGRRKLIREREREREREELIKLRKGTLPTSPQYGYDAHITSWALVPLFNLEFFMKGL